MATPISRFQQQRQALMGNGAQLDPNLAQSLTAGIAALTQNVGNAQKAFGAVGEPSPVLAPTQGMNIAEQIAAIDPSSAMGSIPGSGIEMPSPSGGTSIPQSPTLGGVQIQGGDNSTFAGLLAKTEGGGNYDTLFGHAQRDGKPFSGVRPTQMTIGQLGEFTNPKGAYGNWVKGQVGRVATPIGAGQIVGSTMQQAAKQMGLGKDVVFTPEVQNKMINHLATNRIKDAKSMDAARAGLRAEWEGFKNVPNAQLDAVIRGFGFNFR